jgi:hypothetical protein
MIEKVVHDMQWFIDRIGKKIYRSTTFCECPTCSHVFNHGVFILDKNHAIYLYECQVMELYYYDKEDLQ